MNFSVYFPDSNSEEAHWFSKIPNRSQWVLEQIKKAMMMDEKKLERRIAELREELADSEEMLTLLRGQKESEARLALQKVEQIQEATIKTKEESRKECRICAHPELSSIDSALKIIEEQKGTSKPIRDKYGFSPRDIADHTQHW